MMVIIWERNPSSSLSLGLASSCILSHRESCHLLMPQPPLISSHLSLLPLHFTSHLSLPPPSSPSSRSHSSLFLCSSSLLPSTHLHSHFPAPSPLISIFNHYLCLPAVPSPWSCWILRTVFLHHQWPPVPPPLSICITLLLTDYTSSIISSPLSDFLATYLSLSTSPSSAHLLHFVWTVFSFPCDTTRT